MDEHKYRIIILGAGFSKPAGLPIADELWREILVRSESLSGRASKFNDDLDEYILYRRECDGVEFTRDTIIFEEFLGFLDIEHYLGLRGSDTWSRDGNEGQVVVKTLIGEILSKYMPSPNTIPELYLEFARRLQPHDYVLTFNYDILLERALDAIVKPYRLFPHRYKSSGRTANIIDSSKDEITILKLHGSIDWFDKSQYIELEADIKRQSATILPAHPVFNSNIDWGIHPVLDGPRIPNDPLLNMYRIADIESLYQRQILFLATPWILTPSTNKVIYSSPLQEFWDGLGRAGGTNFGMAIIGYSLPHHDHYARQAIYSLVTNYQQTNWDKDIFGFKKTPLVLVDYRTDSESVVDYRDNYRFVDFEKASLYLNGFDATAVDKLFE
ncbi:MAG: SIR2 family protein [Deltaproteobacteria bacterium]